MGLKRITTNGVRRARMGRKGARTLIGLVVVSAAVLVPLTQAEAQARAQVGSSSKATTNPPPTFTATGYFHIGTTDGRSWFVTPTGQPFYSSGIDHVSPDPDTDETTGLCPYCETIAAEYPTTADWANATVKQLRSYGFNSLGPFTDATIFASKMPYSVQLGMASGDDWFASSFVTNADEVAATQVAPLADDPNLIGYYTDSELDWGPDGSDTQTMLAQYLALPAGSPGLAVAQKYVGNPNGFVYALAHRYFSVTTAAIRMYDTHHLILGVKAEAQEIQPQLLEAARPYVDVFSIDDYDLKPGFAQAIDRIWPQYLPVTATFSNFEQYVKRPIMVGEYSFIAHTPQTPDTVPGVYDVFANQRERATAYSGYIAPLYEDSPWVVGDEWFEYVDEPQGGRFDGENDNFGVVDVENQPYADLVKQMEIMHSIAPDRVVETGPRCDSWAEGAGGVTCTAKVTPTTYPVSILTTSLPNASADTAYSGTVMAIGGKPGYKFKLQPGTSLPAGLRLDDLTGVVYGTHKAYGKFSFGVEVTDSTTPTARTGEGTVTLEITPTRVTIKTTGVPKGTKGKPYSAMLKATGGAPPYHWSLIHGSLPTGLTLASGGSITGTSTVSGTFDVTVEAVDSFKPADLAKETLALVISPPRT
jgi:hypothetical protein